MGVCISLQLWINQQKREKKTHTKSFTLNYSKPVNARPRNIHGIWLRPQMPAFSPQLNRISSDLHLCKTSHSRCSSKWFIKCSVFSNSFAFDSMAGIGFAIILRRYLKSFHSCLVIYSFAILDNYLIWISFEWSSINSSWIHFKSWVHIKNSFLIRFSVWKEGHKPLQHENHSVYGTLWNEEIRIFWPISCSRNTIKSLNFNSYTFLHIIDVCSLAKKNGADNANEQLSTFTTKPPPRRLHAIVF